MIDDEPLPHMPPPPSPPEFPRVRKEGCFRFVGAARCDRCMDIIDDRGFGVAPRARRARWRVVRHGLADRMLCESHMDEWEDQRWP